MTKTHTGSCHCGAVRYQAELDLAGDVSRCNCTYCTKAAQASILIKPSAFKLLAGADSLIDYSRPGVPIRHPFCKVCGIRAFGSGYLEEVGGDYVAVNANTLDDFDPAAARYIYWDGRHNNWEAGPRDTPWPVKNAADAAAALAAEVAAAQAAANVASALSAV